MPDPANSPDCAKRAAPPRKRKLYGITAPRIFTPPLRTLTRRTSRGYEVAEFAEMTGHPLLPWQRWLAIHALETIPGGDFRFRVIVVLVARQNGKSHANRMITLWRMYMEGTRLVLGVAQDVSLAREQWQMCLDTINETPDLAAELEQTRRVNGDEWFKLAGGSRYKISAANRAAGRGLSIGELNIDELREQRSWDAWSALSKTTMAVHDSQIWAMSNAGDDQSVVLNQLREAALSGRDPSIGLFEWSAPDDCALDDVQAWRQANPGMGHTVSEAAIRTALATDPPAVFRTEVLCQRVEQLDGAIDLAAWRACEDPAGTMDEHRGRLTACIDVARDGGHATLAVAARETDGRVRLEIVRAWANTDELRAELPDLLARIRPKTIGWYPGGPAGAIAPMMRQVRDSVELTGGKASEACQGLADLAKTRQVLHPGDPLLDAHVRGARKLLSGDGWRFGRKGANQHVDAAYAAAGAAYLALSMPVPKRSKVRFLVA
jgi:phage terminase large subunit-like protein